MDDLIPVTMVTAGLFLMWCAVKNRKPHKVMQAVLQGKSWEDADKIAGDNPLGDLVPDLPGVPDLTPWDGLLPDVPGIDMPV